MSVFIFSSYFLSVLPNFETHFILFERSNLKRSLLVLNVGCFRHNWVHLALSESFKNVLELEFQQRHPCFTLLISEILSSEAQNISDGCLIRDLQLIERGFWIDLLSRTKLCSLILWAFHAGFPLFVLLLRFLCKFCASVRTDWPVAVPLGDDLKCFGGKTKADTLPSAVREQNKPWL